MPSSQKVSALVFSRKNIGEADRLVTFFTREQGLVRAVAKGVRKIPSSRGGHLELFTGLQALLYESRTGVYVGAAETEHYFHDLHEDHDATRRAYRGVYVFLKLFDVGQHHPELFDAFVRAWQHFPHISQGKRMLLECSLHLQIIRSAGLMPDLRESAKHPVLSARQFALLRYIAARPSYAVRIAAHEDEIVPVERAVHRMVAHAMVQS